MGVYRHLKFFSYTMSTKLIPVSE